MIRTDEYCRMICHGCRVGPTPGQGGCLALRPFRYWTPSNGWGPKPTIITSNMCYAEEIRRISCQYSSSVSLRQVPRLFGTRRIPSSHRTGEVKPHWWAIYHTAEWPLTVSLQCKRRSSKSQLSHQKVMEGQHREVNQHQGQLESDSW